MWKEGTAKLPKATGERRSIWHSRSEPALSVFRYIDRFFGYRFAPAIHQLNLNGAHHGLGQGREVGQRSDGRLFELGGATQERKQSEANERH